LFRRLPTESRNVDRLESRRKLHDDAARFGEIAKPVHGPAKKTMPNATGLSGWSSGLERVVPPCVGITSLAEAVRFWETAIHVRLLERFPHPTAWTSSAVWRAKEPRSCDGVAHRVRRRLLQAVQINRARALLRTARSLSSVPRRGGESATLSTLI
jgi:hypothetical protein